MEIKLEDKTEVSESLPDAKPEESTKPAVPKPSICKRCSVRVIFNKSNGIQIKEGFDQQYKLLEESPEAFNLISDDTLSTLAPDLRSRPDNTCYLCAGILQNSTIRTLMNRCKVLLSEYECVGSVGVTFSNIDLLNVRSFLCGVGGINLQIKTVFKWLMAEELSQFLGCPKVVQNASKADDQDLMVNIEVRLDNDEFMWMCRPPLDWDVFNFSQGKFKSARLEDALGRAKYEDIKSFIKLPGRAVQFSISVLANTTFVGGRYTKMARNMSQTPWLKQDGLLIAGNIEDILCKPLQKAFRADEARMHSAGREDIDVRMLGTGRPFYAQLTNVRKFPTQAMLDELQVVINKQSAHVKCYKLTPVTKSETELVKQGQEEKQKEYRCIIKAENEVTEEMISNLNSVENLDLEQKTPLRVLHRRSPLTRTKRIIKVKARALTREEVEVSCKHDLKLTESLNKRLVVAEVTSEAGTYIKEFVHGDFNRTVPNVGTIMGNRCDMLQLDVVNLSMVWPPERNGTKEDVVEDK